MKKILKSLLGLILTFIIAFNPILSVWASNNSEQIVSHGGETSNEKDGITVSKIISPSSLENYFDITLTVKEPESSPTASSFLGISKVMLILGLFFF